MDQEEDLGTPRVATRGGGLRGGWSRGAWPYGLYSSLLDDEVIVGALHRHLHAGQREAIFGCPFSCRKCQLGR